MLAFLLDPWVKLFLNKVGMTPTVKVPCLLCVYRKWWGKAFSVHVDDHSKVIFLYVVVLRFFYLFLFVYGLPFCLFYLGGCFVVLCLIYASSRINLESWKIAKIKNICLGCLWEKNPVWLTFPKPYIWLMVTRAHVCCSSVRQGHPKISTRKHLFTETNGSWIDFI